MTKYWWKILAVALVFYAIIGGLLMDVPAMDILNETIRNLYYHVTMWFAMVGLYLISMVYSIRYLRSGDIQHDFKAGEAANVGVLLGCLGVATGSVWANFTWGAFWVNDPKLNGAAIAMLIYLAYIVLRNSMEDEAQRARVAAVYNIFAFFLMMVFIFVYPRLANASLHPGMAGNPGFSNYDLNSNMRLVFYPAIIGWFLLGTWIWTLRVRMKNLEYKLDYG